MGSFSVHGICWEAMKDDRPRRADPHVLSVPVGSEVRTAPEGTLQVIELTDSQQHRVMIEHDGQAAERRVVSIVPRIKLMLDPRKPGKYICEGCGSIGTGYTQADAYARWWNAERASGRLHPKPKGYRTYAGRDGKTYLCV